MGTTSSCARCQPSGEQHLLVADNETDATFITVFAVVARSYTYVRIMQDASCGHRIIIIREQRGSRH